jgi:predicted AAA+ superfamily ATPase
MTEGYAAYEAWALDLFQAVTPRADVLSGTLTEAEFAASVEQVIGGDAPNPYGDPAAFFSAT